MGRPIKYTRSELVGIMKSVGKKNLSKKDIDGNPNISCGSMTIIRYFGSWKNALNAADLKPGKITGRKKKYKPNLMDRKKIWNGSINFPETNNIIQKPDEVYANTIIVWKGIPLSQKYLRSIDEDSRDEIAKDLLNFFKKYDFIDNYKYSEIELISAWESLKRNKTIIMIEDSGKYVSNSGSIGYKLFHHFFPNIIKVRGSNRPSIHDILCNDELLWKAIRNRIGNTLLYGGELNRDIGVCQFPMNITPSQISIGAKNMGSSCMASIFKPNIAKAIYQKYVKDNDKVLDYSCGFGTRLMGLMSCNKVGVKYCGYEPNTETYKNLEWLISYFNFNAEIKCCGSEEEIFDTKFDFIFSSPPYFTAEKYSDEISQCYNKYPEYDIWLEKYWRQTVKNIKIMSKDEVIFGVNVGGKANDFMIRLETDMNRIVVEEGFKLVDTIWMKTSKSHLSNKKRTGDNFKLEGIFFYKIDKEA